MLIFMRYILDSETKLAIQELYEDGYEVREIAQMFGVNYQTIWIHTLGEDNYRERQERKKQEYQDRIANQKGFKTYQGYKEAQRKSRKIKLERVSNILGLYFGDTSNGRLSRVAREIGISRQALTNYLKGYNAPAPGNLERILKILEIPEEVKKLLATG